MGLHIIDRALKCRVMMRLRPLPLTERTSMIKLNATQMRRLSETSDTRFLRDLARHLREHFPEQTLMVSPRALEARILRAIERARGYGLTTEEDVAAYVVLTFKLGERFEDAEGYGFARALLASTSLPSHLRIDRLYDIIHGWLPEGEQPSFEAEEANRHGQ